MTKKPEILTGEWCDTETVCRTLGISERTVQKWAQEGHLGFKTIQEGSRRFRLYNVTDVERLRQEGGPPKAERGAQEKPDFRLATKRGGAAELVPYSETRQKPPRRSLSFAVPEGRISISMAVDLSEETRADALAFLEVAVRQLTHWRKTTQMEAERSTGAAM